MTTKQFQAIKGENRLESHETQKHEFAMGLERQIRDASGKASAPLRLPTANHAKPAKPRILIICGDDILSKALEVILLHAGMASERVDNMTTGCEYARSGRFQVVVTAPFAGGGSWHRLADIDSHDHPGVTVILVATSFDLNEWGRAFEYGAFDVLDALHELPRVGEAARRALWAAYLKGAGPRPEAPGPQTIE